MILKTSISPLDGISIVVFRSLFLKVNKYTHGPRQGVSVLLTGRPQCNYRRSHWACWAVSSKISGRRLRRGNFRSFFHNIKNSCYFRSISIHQLDLVQNFFSNLLLLFRSASAQKSVYLMFRPVLGIPLCVYERVRLKTWALSLLPKERCFQKRLATDLLRKKNPKKIFFKVLQPFKFWVLL